MGAFTTQDPLFGDLSDPNTLNQFVYGGDSPVTMSDPTGLFGHPPEVCALVGINTCQGKSLNEIRSITRRVNRYLESIDQGQYVLPPPGTTANFPRFKPHQILPTPLFPYQPIYAQMRQEGIEGELGVQILLADPYGQEIAGQSIQARFDAMNSDIGSNIAGGAWDRRYSILSGIQAVSCTTMFTGVGASICFASSSLQGGGEITEVYAAHLHDQDTSEAQADARHIGVNYALSFIPVVGLVMNLKCWASEGCNNVHVHPLP